MNFLTIGTNYEIHADCLLRMYIKSEQTCAKLVNYHSHRSRNLETLCIVYISENLKKSCNKCKFIQNKRF